MAGDRFWKPLVAFVVVATFRFLVPARGASAHGRLADAVGAGATLVIVLLVLQPVMRRLGGSHRTSVEREKARLTPDERRRFSRALLYGHVPDDERLFPLARAQAEQILYRNIPLEAAQTRWSLPTAAAASVVLILLAVLHAPAGLVVVAFAVLVVACASTFANWQRAWARRVLGALGPG